MEIVQVPFDTSESVQNHLTLFRLEVLFEPESDKLDPDFDPVIIAYQCIDRNPYNLNRSKGLFRDLIAGLPTGRPISEPCSICLTSLERHVLDAEQKPIKAGLVQLRHCGHTFHRFCIVNWLIQGLACPLCCQTIC